MTSDPYSVRTSYEDCPRDILEREGLGYDVNDQYPSLENDMHLLAIKFADTLGEYRSKCWFIIVHNHRGIIYEFAVHPKEVRFLKWHHLVLDNPEEYDDLSSSASTHGDNVYSIDPRDVGEVHHIYVNSPKE